MNDHTIPGIGSDGRITLAHGGGGTAMRALIDGVFLRAFSDDPAAPQEDQARFALADLAALGDRLAFTTDSFVVDPLEFPGGDIGTLAVCGTVNDLAVGGARPVALSAAFILAEGLDLALVRRVSASMAACARAAGVRIVTGDTKVVPRGACDGLFVTTTGIGVIRPGCAISIAAGRPGDVVIVNGTLGDHGAAILCARGDLALDVALGSDCAPLNGLTDALLDAAPDVRCMRDATRGGLAGVLSELAEASGVTVRIDEAALPVRPEVAGVCEILGLDPLYLANEGKLAAVVPAAAADAALAAMRAHPLGREAAVIGRLEAPASGRGAVHLANRFGGQRVVTMPSGEQLPRIC
ncbi:hydrogenase maturation factor [Gluconacetobacter johannae DSM 13595]|uniref:Hydrogenase expression/formation protein HypE n=1 Tax=Gluconacetobacter johannae TaxID=112140 RepID=A0A7W4J8U2_9PROT|nr:hydrogenase expression/formation protein HypE [Gluconacetobacter johannae]MBB2176678.1 hydrogenase expression/formation protein HypE [Gluconacetobacter johannae]GBQ91315.1 hydrogenase maturation factor [Gluconacetobacter johannae DSM 13595]